MEAGHPGSAGRTSASTTTTAATQPGASGYTDLYPEPIRGNSNILPRKKPLGWLCLDSWTPLCALHPWQGCRPYYHWEPESGVAVLVREGAVISSSPALLELLGGQNLTEEAAVWLSRLDSLGRRVEMVVALDAETTVGVPWPEPKAETH